MVGVLFGICSGDGTEEEAFIDIMSIQLPSQYRRQDGRDVVFDVAYQKGNLISVIIPKVDLALAEKFKTGSRIGDIQFYSPAVVFRSSSLVTSVNQIMTGPQQGGHALVLQVMNE